MTRDEYIKLVASYFQKHGPEYGIPCVSAPTAQLCKESDFGSSELAVNAQNYGGIKLKYKSNGECRTPIAIGGYDKASGEFYSGSYTSKVSTFAVFRNLEECVIGYLQFITSSSTYAGLKGLTDARTYCMLVAPYATSPTYSESLWSDYIVPYNLTQYDNPKGETKLSNSSLVNYTKISPNRTTPRNHTIDTITIHHMAGNLTVERCGDVFAPATRKGSSNYGIGSDGRIGMYVEEKDRAWTSSNATNDNRAVTIEVANDGGAPDWHVSDKAYASLIKLVADICKRNNISKLVWGATKSDRVNHKNGCNMTVHQDFSATTCPGPYLLGKMPNIAAEVNKILSGGTPAVNPIADTYDYSLVFNATYYANRYGDLKAVYGTDAAKLLNHFKMFGMSEGRQAIDSFNVKAYKARYTDLQKAFGNDLKQYYIHYMQFGYKEKRIAI